MNVRVLLPALLVAMSLGCDPPANYGRSVYGTNGYSMRNVHASPPSMMVAEKIQRPLLIILDPAKVRDVWELHTPPCETGGDGCERFKLTDFDEFVRRDLKHAMEAYFTSVEVIPPTNATPAGQVVLADVKIDNVRLRPMQAGMLTYEFIQMTWSFALRPAGSTEYAYSYAGTAESDETYATFEAGCTQLVEHAIPAMLKKWVEDGGVTKLSPHG